VRAGGDGGVGAAWQYPGQRIVVAVSGSAAIAAAAIAVAIIGRGG
jgi:hypothetical protein